MKKAAVFGSGISGLSAAHELSAMGWNVSVYEKFEEPGGVARSYRDYNNFPSEYSWRGYGPWYHNTFDIMKKIPTYNGKTVFENLSRPVEFVFTNSHSDNGYNTFMDELNTKDMFAFVLEVVRSATSGEKRTSERASINAAEYMKEKLSPEGWKQFISMFGPWVGISPDRASLHHVMHFMVKNVIPGRPSPYFHEDENGTWKTGKFSKWLVLKKPTNEAWFDPWVRYLESKGVTFHFGNELYSLEYDRRTNKISSALVYNKNKERIETVVADEYISAISPFGMNDVLKNSNEHFLDRVFGNINKLIGDGQHIQVSFRLGFDKHVYWEGTNKAVILKNSEFNITMYRQDDLWNKGVSLGPGIKSLWSGTACVSYKKGTLFGKPLRDLTKEEFKQEILHQLSKDVGFNKMLMEGSGGQFPDILQNMVHFEVWKNWIFSNPISINEPKYVDSTNTRPHQPTNNTPISNFWFAGAHAKTSAELWSMEAACESGRKCADLITGNKSVILQDRGIVLKTLCGLDDILYDMSLPGVAEMILMILLLISFVLLLFYIRKRHK